MKKYLVLATALIAASAMVGCGGKQNQSVATIVSEKVLIKTAAAVSDEVGQ